MKNLGTRKLKIDNTEGGGGGRTEKAAMDPQFGYKGQKGGE